MWAFPAVRKRRSETLQLMMLRPSLAILDETDSGLDVDAVRTVSKGVEEYQKRQRRRTSDHHPQHQDPGSPSMWITPMFMVDGHIVATGDGSLVDEINENGFEQFLDISASRGRR